MNCYLKELLSLITTNTKAFLYSFIKTNISYQLATKVIHQKIYIDFLQTKNHYRIDFFIPYQKSIINIQFSNKRTWQQTTNHLMKDFQKEHDNIIIYHYQINSLKDVEKIKKKQNVS